MIPLTEIVRHLDTELKTCEIPDYPGAHNGLQLENSGQVSRVACAVDATLPVIEKVIATGADLLIVHHGLFWQGVSRLTGGFYRKIKLAMEADLAIYSSHIPLDIHSEYGNNVRLCRALGLGDGEPFFDWKGIPLGREVRCALTFAELKERLAEVVGGEVWSSGVDTVSVGQLGIITGGAGSEVKKVTELGIDTFVSGEGPHWAHGLAEELGLKMCLAGHYATETFGVRALTDMLQEKYSVSGVFVDHPSFL